jgi:predicted metalloprotease with PDZ domain
VRAKEDDRNTVNAAYSIGLWLTEDGSITDTVEGLPAAQAGIGPGMKLIAVNGRKFSADVVRDALARQRRFVCPRASCRKYGILQNFQTRLSRRRDAKPDLLSDMIKPR